MAVKEFYANLAASTLNGAITNVATTIVVASAASFPATPNFTIIVGTEIMLVTGVSGTTFTVTRGQEGTTATAWSTGLFVYITITDASIRRLCRQSLAGSNTSARREINFVNGESIAVTLTDDATNDKCDIGIAVVLHQFAGAPTGTPAAGTMAYDTTNNKLYVYNGSWRGVMVT
jgi:hypothetical protein